VEGRRLLREFGSPDRFTYLRRLRLDRGDLGRLDVATGTIRAGGLYVEAHSGETRLLQEGDSVPEGVWIARRDLDDLEADGPVETDVAGRHGFGEGWGAQGAQLGDPPPAPAGEGAVRTDAYLPGATGDPAQDPASERGLSPRLPSVDAASQGQDQPPVERS
jgi:hypothetical protein